MTRSVNVGEWARTVDSPRGAGDDSDAAVVDADKAAGDRGGGGARPECKPEEETEEEAEEVIEEETEEGTEEGADEAMDAGEDRVPVSEAS